MYKSKMAMLVGLSTVGCCSAVRRLSSECRIDLPSRCGAVDCTDDTCNAMPIRVEYTLTAGEAETHSNPGTSESLEIDAIYEITGCNREREITKPVNPRRYAAPIFAGVEWEAIHDRVYDLVCDYNYDKGITMD